MKKKVLVMCIAIFVILLIVATVFFFLMKHTQVTNKGSELEQSITEQIVEKIDFLKLNSFEEVKSYAEESPIYIQESDDKNFYSIGELYINDSPIRVFYSLNEGGTIKRFDGMYSLTFDELTVVDIDNTLYNFSCVISQFFDIENFNFNAYDEKGMAIDAYSTDIYNQLLNQKAKYELTVIDQSNTYWNVSIVATDSKQIDFKFFRCFDLGVYNDDEINIDLRPLEDTELKNTEVE